MDDFGLDRQELNGSLVSMEFGPGGRIQQLWVSDPAAPEEHEEFQFIAPPVAMGEEIAEDYYPGTILVGARTGPDEPWVLARNSRALPAEPDEDGGGIGFEYDLGFLEEIQATGRFYEALVPVPHIVWDITLRNRSRRPIEIGELALPFAMNNVFEGFPRSEAGIRELFQDRLYVHKFIGGCASYLFAQRLTARPPGLLIFPTCDTGWEFYNHVPASLVTPYRWEGIPVVYFHSRAAIEREGWSEWYGGHSAVVLEPGESRSYQVRFAPADRDRIDNISAILSACGHPAMRVVPAAVAPAEVGIALEIAGVTPARFFTDVEAELETDADDEGGFCFVKPTEPGAVRIGFEDTGGRISQAHLLFTEPIADLIVSRAAWIMEHQLCQSGDALNNAIVPADNRSGFQVSDPEAFIVPFGIECSLSDALFLAEKNTTYPRRDQVQALDRYLSGFVEQVLQNPGDGSVGATVPDLRYVSTNFGRPQVYPLVFSLYRSMARIARTYGETERCSEDYLLRAARCARALFQNTNPASFDGIGIPLMETMPELIEDLRSANLHADAEKLSQLYRERASEITRRKYPFAGESIWTTTGFAEAFHAAVQSREAQLEERAMRCAFAARSLAPSWWWYGSDKRWSEGVDAGAHPAMPDKGELCLGPSTVASSLIFFKMLSRDYTSVPEAYLRLAFGGMLGVWALVRADGAAGMGYCPDAASRQFGMSWTTGDIGLGLYTYLHSVASYVLPNGGSGVLTFGCHFEVETDTGSDIYVIRPWDGVARKIVVRQIGMEVSTDIGNIVELRFDARKRWCSLLLRNPSDKDLTSHIAVRGLWGQNFEITGTELPMQNAEDGTLRVVLPLAAEGSERMEIRVI